MSRLLPRFGTWTCSRAQDVMKICSTTEIIIFFSFQKDTSEIIYVRATYNYRAIEARKEGRKRCEKTSTRAGKSNRARVTFLSLVAIIWGHVMTCGSVLIIESRLWNSMRSEPGAYIYTECAHGQAHQVEFHPGPCCHQIAVWNQTIFSIGLYLGQWYLAVGGIIPSVSALDSDATQ